MIYQPVGGAEDRSQKIEEGGEQGAGGNFLAVGRLIPYKRFDLIVKAFNELELPLKIAGVGNQLGVLRKMARSNPNIEFLGHVSEEELHRQYREARALIFPQVEDFGITPLEAMAHGCPVIAYAEGGAVETVAEGKSGHFFHKQTPEALVAAVRKFESMKFDEETIRGQAKKFSHAHFEETFSAFLEEQWLAWTKKL